MNLAAIQRNCARLRSELGPGTELCAVVKADAYGHGVLPAASAALAGGAGWLAVADAREARELREGGLSEVRLLVMSDMRGGELEQALAADGEVIVWSERQLAEVARAGGGRVHVKLDTGMGRLGTRDADEATRVVRAARETQGIELAGVMTHFATADDLSDGGFFSAQLQMFSEWARRISAQQPGLLVHAANSAATLREQRAHFGMVRCGVAVYGLDPFGVDPAARGLEPALELSSAVAEVKRCSPGQSVGYGRRFVAEAETTVGVVPVGYGDGWRRGLSNNAEVLVAGRREPLVGTVSMDSFTVDLGAQPGAQQMRDERVVLIGMQGSQRITAEEIAQRLDTINYEITCGLTARVPRVYHRDGELVPDAWPAGAVQHGPGAESRA